mgnify:FL=1
MLGLTLEDPDGVEEGGSMRGMELLPVHTVFEKAKTRTRVSGKTGTLHGPWQLLSGTAFEGYEIHMGETTYEPGGTVFSAIAETVGTQHVDEAMANGCQYQNAAGSYVHGLLTLWRCRKHCLGCFVRRKGCRRKRYPGLMRKSIKSSSMINWQKDSGRIWIWQRFIRYWRRDWHEDRT